MKILCVLIVIAQLTGCVFGQSSEVKRAEKILQRFQCNNVETSQLAGISWVGRGSEIVCEGCEEKSPG